MGHLKVLIAEDHNDLAKLYSELVHEAADTVGVFVDVDITPGEFDFKNRNLMNNKYDLVILDWKLIGGTSEKIIKYLNGAPKYMISGSEDPRMKKICVQNNIPVFEKLIISGTIIAKMVRGAINNIPFSEA